MTLNHFIISKNTSFRTNFKKQIIPGNAIYPGTDQPFRAPKMSLHISVEEPPTHV